MSEYLFPIQSAWSRERWCFVPASVIPWEMIAPHDAQAIKNQAGQNLKRLAERGGLSHCEAIAILEDRSWSVMDLEEAIAKLREMVVEYERCKDVPCP